MPDVAKIQAFARRRWNEPQKLKGLDYWSIGIPGKGAFFLGVGNQDNGQTCTVSFAGKAADAMPGHRDALQGLKIPSGSRQADLAAHPERQGGHGVR